MRIGADAVDGAGPRGPWPGRRRRRAVAGALGLLAALAAPAPAAAQPADYAVERIAVTMELDGDGGLVVREALALAFPRPATELIRLVPLTLERRGLDATLDLDSVAGLDEAGRPLPLQVGRSARQLRVRLGGLGPGSRTLTLLYRFRRGVLAVDDQQELVWRVKGLDWEARVAAAEVLVALPPTLPMRYVWATAAIGREPRAEDVSIEATDRFVTVRAARPVLPHEELSLVLSWHAAVGVRPSWWRRAAWLARDAWPLAVPLLVGLGALAAWRSHRPAFWQGRARRAEPPAGLAPGEAGALLAGRAGVPDVAATLVDLAARGHLHLEEARDDAGGLDWVLHRAAPAEDAPPLRPFEQALLDGLLGVGEEGQAVRLSSRPRRGEPLSAVVPAAIEAGLIRAGLLAPRVQRALVAAGAVLLVGGPALAVAGAGWPAAVAASASGLPLLALGCRPWRRTWRGLARLRDARAFAGFVERPDAAQLERLGPGLGHAWLPWAVAFGAAEPWILAQGERGMEAPAWWRAAGPWSAARAVAALARLEEAVGLALGPGRRESRD